MLTFVGVCGIMTQVWLVGPLVRRFGERPLVVAGAAVRGVGWGVMALLPTLPAVLLVLPLIPIGGNVAVPALLALLTYLAPTDQRGFAIGLMESIQGLGRIAGPLLAGWLFERFQPSAPMLFAAGASPRGDGARADGRPLYLRDGDELCGAGLFVDLPARTAQVCAVEPAS